MARFRTKPFELEAVQWFEPGDHPAVASHWQPMAGRTQWMVRGHQGLSTVNPGDWIIAEPDGDGFYPCDPDTFARKYEPVE